VVACWVPPSTLDRETGLSGFSLPPLGKFGSLQSVHLAIGFLGGGWGFTFCQFSPQISHRLAGFAPSYLADLCGSRQD
jgi:hypothetical protein